MKQGYRIIDTDTHVGPNLETLERVRRARAARALGRARPSTASPVTDGGHHLSISPFPYKRTTAAVDRARRRRRACRADSRRSRAPSRRCSTRRRAPASTTSTPPGASTTWIARASTSTSSSRPRSRSPCRRSTPELARRDPRRLPPLHRRVLLAPTRRGSRRPSRCSPTRSGAARRSCARSPSGAVGGGDHAGAPRGPADRRPGARPAVGGDERRRPADHAPLVLLRAAVLPRLPRHVGQRRGGARRGPSVGRPAAARLPDAERRVRPVPQPADRVLRVQRRVVAGVAGAAARPGGLHAAGAAASRCAIRSTTPARAASSAGSSSTRARRSPSSINELLGDGVIMYQSDYPHNGCEFPTSPDIALGWTGIGETAMRKLMYDNAAALPAAACEPGQTPQAAALSSSLMRHWCWSNAGLVNR